VGALTEDSVRASIGGAHTILVSRASDEAALDRALSTSPWGVVVADDCSAGSLGRLALEKLRRASLGTPLVILSPTEQGAVDAIRAGAEDFVLLGDEARLGAALERARETSLARETPVRGAPGARGPHGHPWTHRFQSLFDTEVTAVAVAQLDGPIVEANDTFLALVGYSREELIAGEVSWLAMTPPEYQAASLAAVDELRRTGAARAFEKDYLRRDGGRARVLVSSVLLEDDTVVSVAVDLSWRVREEARHASLLESSLDAIITMNDRGDVVDFNPAAERTFGYRREYAVGRSVAELIIPPRLREAHAGGLARWLSAGEERSSGRRLAVPALRNDGSEFPIEMSLSRLAGAKPPMFVGFIRDVSDQKRAELALLDRARAADLAAAVGLALTASSTLEDLLGRCCSALTRHLDIKLAATWTLGAAGDVLELRASEGSGWPAGNARTRIAVGSGIVGQVAESRRPHFTTSMRAGHGVDAVGMQQEQFSFFAGFPLIVDGELLGVLALFGRHDLTDEALDTLQSVTDAIAVGVHDKQAEGAKAALEEQLRQAQKMEAVGQLAGGVAHDFNNLLSVILISAEMLHDRLDPRDALDPGAADIDAIQTAASRAAELTGQLLTFSRQLPVAPQVLAVNEVLTTMSRMLRRILGAHIELDLRPLVAGGRVRVDVGSLEQVVMNLAINARDAMSAGGTLSMGTDIVLVDEALAQLHLDARVGAYVRVAVTDTGTGMDSATLARMYEPFFTTKEKGKGTGLGLSTVFGIVKRSGGFLRVESTPGAGTTFFVHLPHAEEPETSATLIPPRSTSHGSETILLVEDEEQIRTAAATLLRRHGYTVLDAATPREALRLADEQLEHVDLLLSDVVLPQMSGPDLARRLLLERPQLKVLCMSGYTDTASLQREGGGAFPFLPKPFTVDSLTSKVREVLDSE
jgi:two-component system cell cycle sensor histidine kinase/response regulator CckA